MNGADSVYFCRFFALRARLKVPVPAILGSSSSLRNSPYSLPSLSCWLANGLTSFSHYLMFPTWLLGRNYGTISPLTSDITAESQWAYSFRCQS